MSGERPETSLSIKRADKRTDERFVTNAQRFSIPVENWDNPSVKMFIDTFNRVEALEEDLAAEHHLDVAGMHPSLSMRFARVDNLLRAAMEMLADGLEGKSRRPADRGYIKDKVNLALEPYGLTVIEQPQPSGSQR